MFTFTTLGKELHYRIFEEVIDKFLCVHKKLEIRVKHKEYVTQVRFGGQEYRLSTTCFEVLKVNNKIKSSKRKKNVQ